MKSIVSAPFVMVMALLLAMTSSGCSLIGYGVGHRIDRASTDWEIVQPGKPAKTGTMVKVSLVDGTQLRGPVQRWDSENGLVEVLDRHVGEYVFCVEDIEAQETGAPVERWHVRGATVGLVVDIVAGLILWEILKDKGCESMHCPM